MSETTYLAGCTRALATKASRLFRETGTRYDVIDVSKDGRKGYVIVAAYCDGRHGAHDDRGILTVLYTADGGERVEEDGYLTCN
jgi:hypothetical protein